MCFGARHNVFGKFHLPSSGKLAAILSWFICTVTCPVWRHIRVIGHWSYWGCTHHGGTTNYNNVVITNAHNHIILQPNQLTVTGSLAPGKWYYNVGYSSLSPELVLSVFSHPLDVSSGQEFRVWYGEDLVNFYDHDNDGKVCSDVYALYV